MNIKVKDYVGTGFYQVAGHPSVLLALYIRERDPAPSLASTPWPFCLRYREMCPICKKDREVIWLWRG